MTDNAWVEPPIDELYQEEFEASQPRGRFVIRDAAYALTPRAPIEYIIDKIIEPGSVNVWAGQFGSGKTYSFLYAGVCVANGTPFLDMVTKQTNVLIIDEESGERQISDRLAEVLRGSDADENTPIKYVSMAGINLLKNPRDADNIRALIAETQAGLVIIDALMDIMSGGDENLVKDTQPVFNALRKIANDTGAAIIIVHHANRSGSYRGSSAIPGSIDVMLQIEKDENSDLISFVSKKARYSKPIKFTALGHWNKAEGTFYLTAADAPSKEPSYGKAQSYVLRYLKEHGPAIVNDITGSADVCTAASARQAVYSLAEMGMIKRTNPGVSPMVAAIYAIVETPQDD